MEPITKHTRETPLHARDREWREVELLDRAEKAEADAACLRRATERLETELLVARLWVKELALWLDEVHAGKTSRTVVDDAGLLQSETAKALRAGLARPMQWRRLATVAALVAAPWVALGLLAYLAYVLAV